MRASKVFIFSSLFLTTSLGLALVLAPNSYAREYDNTTHIGQSSAISGQYGAYANNTAYRYQNFNSYLPVELLTGTVNRTKYLYGLAVYGNLNLDTKPVHYMEFGFKLFSNGRDSDFYGDYAHWYLGVKYSNSESSYTEITPNLCSGVESTGPNGTVAYLDYTCTATFQDGDIPTSFQLQYGIIGNFVHESDSPIAVSTGSTISLTDVWYSWTSASSGDDSAAINQLGDTMEDIHDDEKNTINNAVGDAESDANSIDTSGWSLTNPFTSWLALFGDNKCADIPTIAGWINSNETRICTPWSDSVRSGVTPIFSVLSTTLIFGFIVRWLKQGSSE